MSTFYEEGPYTGEITSQALGKAKTGTPQFILQFKVLGGQQEYTRTIYMPITDKTVEYVVPQLERLGYTASTFGALDPEHPDHQSFVGNHVGVYCKHKADQEGNMRETWMLSRGSSALKVERLERSEVRKLDALFGKELRGATAKATGGVATTSSAAMEITDDDIPF